MITVFADNPVHSHPQAVNRKNHRSRNDGNAPYGHFTYDIGEIGSPADAREAAPMGHPQMPVSITDFVEF